MLGYNTPTSATMASQITLIVALFLVGWGLLRTWQQGYLIKASHCGWIETVLAVFFTTGLRQAYYLVGRAIGREDLDLWTLHPVPEILAAVVAASYFAMTVPLWVARYPHHWQRAIVLNTVLFAVIWLGSFWVLSG